MLHPGRERGCADLGHGERPGRHPGGVGGRRRAAGRLPAVPPLAGGEHGGDHQLHEQHRRVYRRPELPPLPHQLPGACRDRGQGRGDAQLRRRLRLPKRRDRGQPVARELSRLGYQAFVVDYRIRPYTAAEGALDLARAVRFVRAHADAYGVHANDIAVMGFSAGGIMSGEMLLNYDGTVTGAALDSRYRPDALDRVSADAGAAAMIYSFYGGLAVASTDVAKLAAGGLPPTYFSYGTQDPYVSQFEANIAAVRAAGVRVETNVLNGMAHGYGALGDWIPNFDTWLTAVFETK
ncbi:MAG: alpha/beta hydrolase [Micropruina sp.]|nr:alpha/beta hydrolase [Micropruina sp.]